MDNPSLQELRDAVAALTEKVAVLEARVESLEDCRAVPEADMVAIGAAVAAFFGHKAKVRAIRYGSQTRWAAATRARVHDRSVPHVR